MAQITAAMVKQLREMTDSPMMECKKALVEADGDMDAAVDVLRKTGLHKAANHSGRHFFTTTNPALDTPATYTTSYAPNGLLQPQLPPPSTILFVT